MARIADGEPVFSPEEKKTELVEKLRQTANYLNDHPFSISRHYDELRDEILALDAKIRMAASY